MITLQDISGAAAFLAGLLSFLSPCVLPLVPTYIVFITGLSMDEVGGNGTHRLRAFIAALLFVFGFSAVFVAMGATATALGGWLFRHSDWFVRIGGAIVLVIGLHIAGIMPLPFIGRERRFAYKGKLGLMGAPLIGVVFAFGWSPCVGPVLAAILGMAAIADTVGRGIALLALYSAGLAIPFLLAALAAEIFIKAIEGIKNYLQIVNILAGKLLALMGVLLVSGRFKILTGFGHMSWPITTAGLILILIILTQIAILVRVKKTLAANGIARLPNSVVALFFVDILAIAGVLLALSQFPQTA